MSNLVVIYEDIVQEAILRKILGSQSDVMLVNKQGKTKIDERTSDYLEAAAHNKVIILRDLDKDADCAPDFLRKRGLADLPSSFVYRLSVREAEAWVLADKEGFCRYFRCGYQSLRRRDVELIDYPKELLLQLVWGGRLNSVRKNSIVLKAKNEYKRRYAYNTELCKFIDEDWDLNIAKSNSDSLNRCKRAINNLLAM